MTRLFPENISGTPASSFNETPNVDPSMIDISETLVNNPELLSSLAQMMKNNTNEQPPQDGVVVVPEPGFVIKTTIVKGDSNAQLFSDDKVYMDRLEDKSVPR
jgi:hypothetical protein